MDGYEFIEWPVLSSQVVALIDRYRLLLIDLPDHGLSIDFSGPYGHVEMMGHVQAMWDQANTGPTHIWAMHKGTAIGLFLGASEPEWFNSLYLEGGRNLWLHDAICRI